jgi:hypothetical protein
MRTKTMSNVLVLGVRQYSFVDEKDGRVVEGCTVSYVDPQMLEDDQRQGLAVLNVSAPTSLYPAFASPPDAGEGVTHPPSHSQPGRVPGVFTLQWGQRPGKGGRPVSLLIGAEFVKSVDIAKITDVSGKKP